MQGKILDWFEIYVEDLERAGRFYQQVLGVSLQPLGPPEVPMLAFPAGETATGGALVHHPQKPASENSTVVYFTCEDCSEEASRVEAAGGTLVREKMSIGEHGFVALAKDSEQNLVGFHSTR